MRRTTSEECLERWNFAPNTSTPSARATARPRGLIQLFQGYVPAVQKLREGAIEGSPVFKVGIDNGNHLITSFPDKNIHRQLNKYLCDQKRERIRKQLLEKDVNLAAAFTSSHSVKHIM